MASKGGTPGPGTTGPPGNASGSVPGNGSHGEKVPHTSPPRCIMTGPLRDRGETLRIAAHRLLVQRIGLAGVTVEPPSGQSQGMTDHNTRVHIMWTGLWRDPLPLTEMAMAGEVPGTCDILPMFPACRLSPCSLQPSFQALCQ